MYPVLWAVIARAIPSCEQLLESNSHGLIDSLMPTSLGINLAIHVEHPSQNSAASEACLIEIKERIVLGETLAFFG